MDRSSVTNYTLTSLNSILNICLITELFNEYSILDTNKLILMITANNVETNWSTAVK